jgi:pimeloyl-ACP methyl ester carboxylesterase
MTDSFVNSKLNNTNVRKKNLKYQTFQAIMRFLWDYSPGLSKAIVKKMFFSPAVYRAGPLEKKYLKDSQAFEIIVNGKTVKCWKWGRGPAILLAHGWNGRGIQLHRFIDPLVEASYTVIAFDGPGHGESQGRTSSYFEYSDVIRSFFQSGREFNIKGAIAHSFGGAALLNGIAKEKYPLEAILISPALRLSEILDGMFKDYGVPEPLFQTLIKEYEDQFGYNLRKDNPYNLLDPFNSNILIVHDEDDETIPYADSREASRQFKHISLHTTHGLGHKSILFDSATINRIVDHIRKKVDVSLFSNQSHLQEEIMKLDTFEIIKEYKTADFEKRLYLFLECPGLREDFIHIDRHENETDFISPATSQRNAF